MCFFPIVLYFLFCAIFGDINNLTYIISYSHIILVSNQQVLYLYLYAYEVIAASANARRLQKLINPMSDTWIELHVSRYDSGIVSID